MRRVILMLSCVLGAFFLAWALRSYYIVTTDPARAFGEDGGDIRATPPTKAQAAATPTPCVTLSPEEQLIHQADVDFMKERVNILFVGFDESPERDEEDSDVYRNEKNNFRSDVLLLMAVNFAKRSVRLISIPRDTYSPIYNTRGRWKINAAFAKGGALEGEGFTYAMKTVEMLMGVPVTYYAGVNMEGLKSLVNAMGGVDYDVDVEIHLNGRTLKKGMQHLDGQQVLDYCRARKGISTDLGRNDRQQRMLLAIFRQLKQENKLTSLPSLYALVAKDLHTNLNVQQIAALAAFSLRLDEDSFQRSTLEGEYVHNVYNASYYVLKNSKLAALVKEEFGVTVKRDKKYDLATVKRDKAAAEAKKAAESMEEVAGMLTIPADTMGDYQETLLARAQARARQLTEAIDAGVEWEEIVRMRDSLNESVAALRREGLLSGQLPSSFRQLEE